MANVNIKLVCVQHIESDIDKAKHGFPRMLELRHDREGSQKRYAKLLASSLLFSVREWCFKHLSMPGIYLTWQGGRLWYLNPDLYGWLKVSWIGRRVEIRSG